LKPSKHENVKSKPCSTVVRHLRVRVAPWAVYPRAWLRAGPLTIPCSIGRTGLTRRKREGDGASPIGHFALVDWRFAPGRPAYAKAKLPHRLVRPDQGWCDDPSSGAYNRQVALPFKASHEELSRGDGKYDVVGILDYNLSSRRRGGGSAIFFHLCGDDFGSTAGCVAIRPADMRKLLPLLARRPMLKIG